MGMGGDLARTYAEARETFEEADAVLGWPLSRLCFEGPAECLQQTVVTQPAILTASVACWRILRRYGWEADVVAGLSLGEYTALVAAGSLEFRDAVALVHRRGRFMDEAVPAGEGGMAAVLGLPREAVEDICRQAAAQTGSVVQAVNYNCPGQLVIAGAAGAVARAAELARGAGARRVVPLAVSGPFHSSLMAPAAERLAAELERVPIRDAHIPVVSNVTGEPVQAADEIRRLLVRQVASPVLWEDVVRRMAAGGVQRFVEVGPGAVLTGFVRKIEPGAVTAGVQDLASLEKLLDLRGEVC